MIIFKFAGLAQLVEHLLAKQKAASSNLVPRSMSHLEDNMKVIKSKRNGNTMSLEVEASHEELESKFDGAFKKVSKKASLPGFRKGKVPRRLFEREFGKEVIIQEAIYDVVNDTYKLAIEELSLKVIDYPKNVDIDDYKENNPIKFRCEVDVEPEVKLKKYKGLKVSFEEKKAEKDALQKEMDILIGMHATYESVDREAKDEDIVRFNATATINGEPFELWSRENQATRLGVNNYGNDFDEALKGLQKGDKKTFSVTYADDFKTADVQGKTVDFDVEVSEVRERILPELTDELAKKIDKECQTVDEWKTKLQNELDSRFENENKQQKEQVVFDALLEENPLEIPDAMVEQEINSSLMQFEYSIRQQGMDLKQYMQITNKTEGDLRTDLKETSLKRIQLRKLIEAIIEKEKLDISDDELQKEVDSWNHESIKTVDDVKHSKSHDLDILKNNLLDQKVRDFIIDSAKIK
tara:strand:+ start:8616 stop:10016 length:1401 start_codon:yes stop_codon:yes gene_type:complete